ncbi:MAG: ImmA/IrrE family metallo-endopeptidase, partial [Chloroflexi bacterium]|nr:ImmA/IrrE family metallo-endopeptidase [Chloroflexota bacterium]
MEKPGTRRYSVLRQKQRVVNEIRQLQRLLGQTKPPFRPEDLAPLVKAKIEYADMSRQAILVPTVEGFTIRLSVKCHRRRQRVLCAHEVAHTFLYDASRMPPRKLEYDFSNAWHEEDICNHVAGEILMPRDVAINATKQHGYPSVKAFAHLMEEFDVSSEFLAWRLSQLALWRVILVLCRPISRQHVNGRHAGSWCDDSHKVALTPRGSEMDKDLAVWKVFKHPDYRNIHVRRKGVHINGASSASVAFRTQADIVRREYWNLNGAATLVVAQTRAILEAAQPHTVSILTVDKDEQDTLLAGLGVTEQLSFF